MWRPRNRPPGNYVVHCISSRISFSTYHDYENTAVIFSVVPWRLRGQGGHREAGVARWVGETGIPWRPGHPLGPDKELPGLDLKGGLDIFLEDLLYTHPSRIP